MDVHSDLSYARIQRTRMETRLILRKLASAARVQGRPTVTAIDELLGDCTIEGTSDVDSTLWSFCNISSVSH